MGWLIPFEGGVRKIIFILYPIISPMPHHETYHTTPDGQKLFLQGWEPEGEKQAAIFLLHGLGEHSGRYRYLADQCLHRRIAVYSFDGRGHGKSAEPSPTGYIERLELYLEDIDSLFNKMQSYVGEIPCFLMGHSMGGGLATHYAIFQQPRVQGVILTGPSLLPGEDFSPFLLKLAKVLSRITPKLAASKVHASAISKDLQVVKRYEEDPLVLHKGVPARTGAELLKMIDDIQANLEKFLLPVLIMHGTQDTLTNIEGSKLLYKKASSNDKTLRLFERFYHEILNEPERDQVIGEILEWIEERIAK